MNKWTREHVQELCCQALKKHYDHVYKEPDLTEPLLTITQQYQYMMDPEFKKQVDNLTKKEIQEWNNKQIKERDELLYE